ncbi:unnamed protein product [Closterium sp. Naga37s-1]|nr:unnamed protein product [Closterium sp. Naga37s-1]
MDFYGLTDRLAFLLTSILDEDNAPPPECASALRSHCALLLSLLEDVEPLVDAWSAQRQQLRGNILLKSALDDLRAVLEEASGLLYCCLTRTTPSSPPPSAAVTPSPHSLLSLRPSASTLSPAPQVPRILPKLSHAHYPVEPSAVRCRDAIASLSSSHH